MFWMDSKQLGFTKAFMRSGELALRQMLSLKNTVPETTGSFFDNKGQTRPHYLFYVFCPGGSRSLTLGTLKMGTQMKKCATGKNKTQES